ncbi:MAG: hydantoinase/oxoprolinase family protein [Actinomycetota bacterium]|nr:MAG: hydantoinase/oxoprolinase family protein [Actinomycetota bacterium]
MTSDVQYREQDGYVIGVDIGGTFTDCAVTTPDGRVVGAKSPTTPADRSVGFFAAIDLAAAKVGISSADLYRRSERIVHGTTTGTNAIVAREGAKTALLTTAGLRDVMFLMAGGGRTSGLDVDQALHGPSTDKPIPIVPKHLTAEIVGRIDVDGEVIAPLDEAAARATIERLVAVHDIEALAISLVWSIKNPVHEHRVAELAAEVAPWLYTTCSSDLISHLGEYERTTTTVMNAYIGPLMVRYIDSIERGAAERGFGGRVLFAQCAGGAITGAEAKSAPIRTVQSGPVAGIVSSELLAQRIDTPQVLLADMGGTTFDVSVINQGRALRRTKSLLQRYELALPMLDVESIGAGGGSIAFVDESGRLNVGPRSAGAVPGPACYGAGGAEPTVTDADVVLGYIDPDRFLNGRMTIRPDLAERAVAGVGAAVGLDVDAAAAGICRIVDSKMADLIRRMSVLKGFDPRQFVMYAFGGGGPVHATAVAREAGVSTVIVPLPAVAAMWSAFGAAVADVTYVYQEPMWLRLPAAAAPVNDAFAALEARALATVAAEGLADLPATMARSVRVKYRMQVHDVEVPMPSGVLTAETVADLDDRFNEVYEQIFGVGAGFREGGADLTGFQVRYQGQTAKPELRGGEHGDTTVTRTSRSVYWPDLGERRDTPVLATATGVLAEPVEGPALIALPDTVVVLHPGQRAVSDSFGNLVIDTGA